MSKYHNAFQGFVKVFTGAAKRGEKGNPTTIIGIAPSKNIKKFQKQKEKIIKMTDSYKKKVDSPEAKKSMNEGTSETLSKISKIYKGEPITKKVKKAKGGRIGLKGGGNDMGSNLNKSINSIKNMLENRKGFKKKDSKISSLRRKRSPMERDRVISKMKSDAQAMGGNVRTAGEMSPLKGESIKSFEQRTEAKVGGRMGRKMGGGTDMSNTNVKKKYKGFSKLPETVQIKINKKLAKKV